MKKTPPINGRQWIAAFFRRASGENAIGSIFTVPWFGRFWASKRRGPALAALVVLFCPTPVEAHLVTTGLGPVYDGIGHFFLSPGDGLAALALALLAGMRGTAAGRRALFVLPIAWLAGGLGGLAATGWASQSEEMAGALSLLLLGILVASDIALPVSVVAGLAALLGVGHGFFNGMGMIGLGVGQGVLELTGVAATLFVLVSLAAATAVVARPRWARTAVRVVGSWIGASGLLWLGWTLHGIK